jgi:hypothetical protein
VIVPFGAGAKLPGVLESGVVVLPGAGAKLPGVEVPGSGMLVLPGTGVTGVVVLPGTGVVSEGLDPGTVVLFGDEFVVPEGLESGVVVLFGVVLSGVGLVVVPLLGTVASTGVPPSQREFSGDLSHRIFMPSGDILISVGELVDELLD